MKFNKIFDAFPTPKFLDIPYAGLSISDSAVRCMQFGKKGGGLYIEKYTEKALPVGVMTNGQINNQEEIINWLDTLKYENSSYSFLNTTDGYTLIFEGKKYSIKQLVNARYLL